MTRRPRSSQELQALLEEQIGFLERSGDAFDRGFASEAKRLAVTVRLLVHDTKQSASLLGQLNLKGGRFYDSALDLQPGNVATHSGLVVTVIKRGATRPVAMLDGAFMQAWVDFDAWWLKPVVVDDHRHVMTRKDLVLTMANQDGGAHVDPALDEAYHRLTREGSTGWLVVDGAAVRPLPEPAGPSMRQIAHELLRSLLPDYRKTIKYEAEFFLGGVAAFDSPVPPGYVPRVGRNDPCPCGSGRKYKKCHGKA